MINFIVNNNLVVLYSSKRFIIQWVLLRKATHKVCYPKVKAALTILRTEWKPVEDQCRETLEFIKVYKTPRMDAALRARRTSTRR